jgi:hypothetical protein
MDRKEQLEAQRREIVQKMLARGSARKGTICEQYVPVMKGGAKTHLLRGPYWVLTTKKEGKTVSERLPTPQSVERAREEIANHQHLTQLFREFEELTEQLGALERRETSEEASLKKKPKSPSKRARK